MNINHSETVPFGSYHGRMLLLLPSALKDRSSNFFRPSKLHKDQTPGAHEALEAFEDCQLYFPHAEQK